MRYWHLKRGGNQAGDSRHKTHIIVPKKSHEQGADASHPLHDLQQLLCPAATRIIRQEMQNHGLAVTVQQARAVEKAPSPADVDLITGFQMDPFLDPPADLAKHDGAKCSMKVKGFKDMQDLSDQATHSPIQPLLAAELLQELLSSQASPLVPRNGHRLGAEMTVGEAHGEVPGVVVDELDQGGNTGGAGIRLLYVDAT